MKERVKEWAEKVGMFTDGDIYKQMQKIAEEVVECSMEVAIYDYKKSAAFKAKTSNIEKEFGDILFSTIVACYMLDLDPGKCLEMACDKNYKRIDDGRMVNGTFVKKEDL